MRFQYTLVEELATAEAALKWFATRVGIHVFTQLFTHLELCVTEPGKRYTM